MGETWGIVAFVLLMGLYLPQMIRHRNASQPAGQIGCQSPGSKR
jgi:hypothetical protein